MKTKEEIDKQIAALKEIRPKIRTYSMFGTDNLAQLDAQVNVLENSLNYDDIYEEYDHSGMDEELLSSALCALDWLNGNTDIDDLAEDWPLKE